MSWLLAAGVTANCPPPPTFPALSSWHPEAGTGTTQESVPAFPTLQSWLPTSSTQPPPPIFPALSSWHPEASARATQDGAPAFPKFSSWMPYNAVHANQLQMPDILALLSRDPAASSSTTVPVEGAPVFPKLSSWLPHNSASTDQPPLPTFPTLSSWHPDTSTSPTREGAIFPTLSSWHPEAGATTQGEGMPALAPLASLHSEAEANTSDANSAAVSDTGSQPHRCRCCACQLTPPIPDNNIKLELDRLPSLHTAPRVDPEHLDRDEIDVPMRMRDVLLQERLAAGTDMGRLASLQRWKPVHLIGMLGGMPAIVTQFTEPNRGGWLVTSNPGPVMVDQRGNKVWVIECIYPQCRLNAEGQWECLTKWMGYDQETWELEEEVGGHAPN
ncbi:hypothetical protein FOMPIDRAFT_88600 [Fomitopsis schrenkii]|uniref:Chromo domain-containing protein n=1 Tax=Fomitopsis schrenkii TaxID=2126942 RepID=S8FN09_FOMSC|nr:hypothetical protein FOMPIDRAFT_88600 [Fomitopsis schrenkii]